MNIRKKLNDSFSDVKQLEGMFADKCKAHSKDMNDYLSLQYYNGVLNTFKFFDAMMNRDMMELFIKGFTDGEYEILFNELMRYDKETVN
jgi:hypothetical protein